MRANQSTDINELNYEKSRRRDGALYMIGSVAEILLKRKEYRDQLEEMLNVYIFPEFNSRHGHMRARACWVLQSFGDIKFKNEQTLIRILDFAIEKLLRDPDLPVKVEAAMIIQVYLTSQDKAAKYIEPQIKEITLKLLEVIKETEIDDLNSAMQKVVHTFSEQLLPIVVNICGFLEEMFSELLQDEGGIDDTKDETAMGFLNTIETLLTVFEERPEVAASIQPHVIKVIQLILEQNNTCKYAHQIYIIIFELFM